MNFDLVNIGTGKYTMVLASSELSNNCSPKFLVVDSEDNGVIEEIKFQDGPIKEFGVNGVANEDLIVMVMHRLNQFQKSDYACKENADAVRHLQGALDSLRARTNKRVQRGVEGTSNK